MILYVDKIIIPAAGLGTRLLTVSKELPKEMLPIFTLDCDNKLCVKPLFETIFNQSFKLGFRKFCFIGQRMHPLGQKLERLGGQVLQRHISIP